MSRDVSTKRIIAALFACGALAFAGCGGDDDDTSTTTSSTTSSTGATGTTGATGAGDSTGGSGVGVKGAIAPLAKSLESNGYGVTELPLEQYKDQPSGENGAEAGILVSKDGESASVYAFPTAEQASAWAADTAAGSVGTKVEVVETFGFNASRDAKLDLETVIADAGL